MGYTNNARLQLFTRLRWIIRLQKVHIKMCTVNPVGNCKFPCELGLLVNKQ